MINVEENVISVPIEIIDEDGKWLVYPSETRDLIEPSPEYVEKMKRMTEEAQNNLKPHSEVDELWIQLKERDMVSEKQKIEFDLAIVELWEALLN